MTKYASIFLVVGVVIALYFIFFNKKETFSLDFITNAINDLTKTKPRMKTQNLTEAIVNLSAKENPKPTAPQAAFDDTTYVPGFYKIQTSFPKLTKWMPRRYDLEG